MIYRFNGPSQGNCGGGGGFKAVKKPSSDSLGASSTHYKTLGEAAKAAAKLVGVEEVEALEKLERLKRLITLPLDEGKGYRKAEMEAIFNEYRDLIFAGSVIPGKEETGEAENQAAGPEPQPEPEAKTGTGRGFYATLAEGVREGSRKHGITPYHVRQAIVGAILDKTLPETNIPAEKVDKVILGYIENGRKPAKRAGRKKKAESDAGFLSDEPEGEEKEVIRSKLPKAKPREALVLWFREYVAKGEEGGDFDEGFLKAIADNFAFRSDKRNGEVAKTSNFSSLLFREAAAALISESGEAADAVSDFMCRWRQTLNKYGRSQWAGRDDALGEGAKLEMRKVGEAGLDCDQLRIVANTLRSLLEA